MSGDLNPHALNDGAPAFRCHSCHDTADWRITRRGDAVVEWACQEHLAMICTYLQRDHEITELVITDHRKATEWNAIGKALHAIAKEARRG